MKFLKLASSVFIIFLAIFVFTKNIQAQVPIPTATCTITQYTMNGATFPFVASNGITRGWPFTLTLSCSPGGQYSVSLYWMGTTPYTSVSTTTYGTGSGTYGPIQAQYDSITPYRLSIEAVLSGLPATMNCTNCMFRIVANNGDVIPPPPTPAPTPIPIGSLICPPATGAFNGTSRYVPDPPVLNAPFQIQFNVPSGVPAGNYYVQLSGDTGGTGGKVNLLDASGFGVWVANIPALTGQMGWQLYGQVVGVGTIVSCGISGSVFNGVGVGGPGGEGPPGSNPCTTGPDGKCCTAIGCVSTNLKEFTTKLLSIAIGIAGALALILMVRGAIKILMSQGDPQKVNDGREVIIAAIAGLLFLIFSVLILQFIGVKIFGGISGLV